MLLGDCLSMSAHSKHPAAAVELLRYLTSPTGNKPIAETGEDGPGNKITQNSSAFLDSPALPPGADLRPFAQSFQHAFAPPVTPAFTQMMTDVGTQFGLYYDSNKISLSQFVSKANAAITKDLQSSGTPF
jgi:spermidine/putrescine-binding protein